MTDSPPNTQAQTEDPAVEPGDLERAQTNTFLGRCALGVSLTYMIVYAVIDFQAMVVYSSVFVFLYLLINRWQGPSSYHAKGVVLMGVGTVHLGGLCVVFAAPEAGTQFFLMLIPILSLVAISPKRRAWWWVYTVASTALLLWIELNRDTWDPLYPFDEEVAASFPYWRASSALITIWLIVASFRNFHNGLMRARKELKESYENVEKLLVEVEHANDAKSRFLAQITHELRTPLNGILGTSEAMQEGTYGALNEGQHKALTTMERAANHQLALVNDLLDLAKIESGNFEPIMEPVYLPDISKDVVQLLREKALQTRLNLDLTNDDKTGYVVSDSRRVRQMLLNLVSNAMKFTPEGGTVTLALETQDTWVHLAVTDTGIGIPPEALPHLFDAFTQLDSEQQRKHTGTGLGLNLTASLAETLGGRLDVQSEVGKGSTFTVILPNQVPDAADLPVAQKTEETPSDDPTDNDEAPAGLQESKEPLTAVQEEVAETPLTPSPPAEDTSPSLLPADKPARPDGQVHVLLVDDTPTNIGHVRDYLVLKGHHVTVATDGLEAIEKAQAMPDIIFMDVQMPGMDGLEAIRRLRADAKTQDLYIVSLTSFSMDKDRDRCIEAGANDYESKPVSLKRVLELVESRKDC